MPNTKGFTLIELLLVVAIVAILSSFLIPGFSNYIDNQNLLQATELFRNDLRSAQNKALTGVGSSIGVTHWGVKIESTNAADYLIFSSTEASDSACGAVSSGDTSEILPGGAVVRNANQVCVFFSVRNGDAIIANYGSDTFQIAQPDKAACHGVQVNSAGMIRGVDLCP